MSTLRKDALAYHESGRPGKIEVTPTKPFKNQRDLSLAYTPGVAEPCRAIADDPQEAYRYTAKGNLVAVVSNGTAVLGLGNIGPLAGKPVMEGKGILFKTFADIDVFDLEVGSEDPEDVIRFCQLLEPTVGGINLEDIRAPDCFHVEEVLRETLDIPVFHDDQHGTAIISGAALLNAAEVTGKDLATIRVVFSGAGAAAIATAEHYVRLGVTRENILMVDRHGVIYEGRGPLDKYKQRMARKTSARTLEDALKGADVFVGLSVGGLMTQDMVRVMADQPIIFALANPDPEILPDDVFAVREDAVVATGRSDFPNQVNNVLGFPFIFRGALDARATGITEEMKMAATRALADLAKEDVPDSVMRAYGADRMRFGRDYLIPKPFDPRVLLAVAPAVAQAAVTGGVARVTIDLDEYRTQLEGRLGRTRALMRGLAMRAARDPKRIVFPEGEDARVLRAARIMTDEGIAHPIVLGSSTEIARIAEEADVQLHGVTVVDPDTAPARETYAQAYWERRRRKGITRADARERAHQPAYFGCMMLAAGDADALVAGENMYYPETIRPALETVGSEQDGHAVCSIYMLLFPHGTYFLADCTVNIEPDAPRLADIAAATADFVWHLGIEPRVAMLSFSNFGSARHPSSEKVADAVRILHGRDPQLAVDGEMQADTAIVEQILTGRYPFSRLQKPANVLVFPDLNAANIAYKLLIRLGGAQAIGPILVGMAKPVHVLQRDSDVSDVVNIAVIATIDAQERARASAR
ncbi:MAG TPA: NADP-dependent malic enzyme [Gemmatimonadales bacterium]|nr:NADP-dependent malic enzyme [Gemmatimonadales bacterium]